jgi:hypothetical protein
MRPRVFSSLLLAWALLSVPATGQTPALEPDLQGHWLHDAVLACLSQLGSGKGAKSFRFSGGYR